MHKKLHRRLPLSHGLEVLRPRQGHEGDGGEGYVDDYEAEPGLFISGPVVNRVTQSTLAEVEATNTTPHRQMVSTVDTLVTSSTEASKNIISFPARTSSYPIPGSTEAADSVGGTPHASKLPSGVVVGTVLGLLGAVAVAIFFFVRSRYVRKRLQLRNQWALSKSIDLSSEPKSSHEGVARPALTTATPIYNRFAEQPQPPPVPPKSATIPTRPPFPTKKSNLPSWEQTISSPSPSYGNRTVSVSGFHCASPRSPFDSPSLPNSPTKKLLTPVYGPPSTVLSKPLTAVVISTFIPTLPDELDLSAGETLLVLSEFDDGWAMCLNSMGEQGMVPLECLDVGEVDYTSCTSRSSNGKARRISSLLPSPRPISRF